MKTCSKCQTDNENSLDFCRKCGMRLKRTSLGRVGGWRERRQEAKRERLDQQRARDKAQAERAERKREEARYKEWALTDQGRASIAFEQGARFFQMQRAVSETTGSTVAMVGTSSASKEVDRSARSTGIRSLDEMAHNAQQLSLTDTLAVVEEIGWKLNDVGYTFRQTRSESRDKFLASGQQIAISGEIIGIYLFRRGTT